MTSGFKNLMVYKKSFALAMEIFETIKKFPIEKKHALTDRDLLYFSSTVY